MSTPRLVQAPISICFSDASLDKEIYEKEYQHLSESDPILLEKGTIYYGRIEMPIYPKHDVGVFFQAQSSTLAKIIKMHDRDEKEWNAYMTARERILIREARENR